MTTSDVHSLVLAEIGDDWSRTNAHGVDLRSCLVEPRRIQIIWHSIRKGQVTQQTQDVWLILEERPATKDGYIIVFEESRKMFGLASPGFPSDPHRCLDGYYRDFWTAFEGM